MKQKPSTILVIPKISVVARATGLLRKCLLFSRTILVREWNSVHIPSLLFAAPSYIHMLHLNSTDGLNMYTDMSQIGKLPLAGYSIR